MLHAVFVQRDSALQRDFGEHAFPVVLKQEAWRRIASDEDVLKTGTAEVGSCDRHTVTSFGLRQPGAFTHIHKRSVTVVSVKEHAPRRQASGTAVDGNALPIAVRVFAGASNLALVEFQIVGDYQIQESIARRLDEGAAGAPAVLAVKQARLLGDVGKGSVAVVAIENVLSPVGDEEIEVAVIVVIAHAHARSPFRARQARLCCDVCKRAVAIVVVQTVRCAFRCFFKPPSVQDEEIGPSVVVIIDPRQSAADGFQDVLLGVDAAVDDGFKQACFLSDVAEGCMKRKS